MKKLREYKTLGCNFAVYDEGIEIQSFSSNRFIKKEQIADVTIKNFLSTIDVRLNNSKEVINLRFSSKNIRNKEHQRLGQYLQGKMTEEQYTHDPLLQNVVMNSSTTPASQVVKEKDFNTWGSKGGTIAKAIFIVFFGLPFLVMLINVFIFSESETKTTLKTTSSNSIESTSTESNPESWNLPEKSASTSTEKSSDITKDILATRIKNLKEPFDSTQYRKDISALEDEIDLFRSYGRIYNEHVYHSDPEVRALAEEYKKQLVILQRSEFPKMRQAYAKMADELMWEKDIDVEVSGTGNKTVTLTGSIFASNSNVKSTQLQLNDIFVKFRFSQVRFKWSEYATEYQSYQTDAPDDGELML
jgi:cytoskeletal protein RodZ